MQQLQNKVAELFKNGTIHLMIGFKNALNKLPVPCFIDNEKDRTIADTVIEQQTIGIAIADAIYEYVYKKAYVEAKIDDALAINTTPPPLKVFYNGVELNCNDQLQNGETFIQLRPLLEQLKKYELKTTWNDQMRSVFITDKEG